MRPPLSRIAQFLILLLLPLAPVSAQRLALDGAEAFLLPLPDGRGLLVTADSGQNCVSRALGEVEDSTTALDIRVGDCVTAVGRRPVTDLTALESSINGIVVGTEIALTVRRGTAEHAVRYTRPQGPRMALGGGDAQAGAAAPSGWVTDDAGADSSEAEVVIAGYHIRAADDGGALVALRTSDPGAAAMPLRVNDRIVAVQRRSIANYLRFEEAWAVIASGTMVEMQLQRGDRVLSATFRKP